MKTKLCLVLALTSCLVQIALSSITMTRPGGGVVSITGPRRGENRVVCGGLVVRSNYAYCRSTISCTRQSQCPSRSRCPLTRGHWICRERKCRCHERGSNHVVAQNVYATGPGAIGVDFGK